MKSMLQLRERKLKFNLKTCAEVILPSSKNSWNTVDHSNLSKNQTIRRVWVSLKDACCDINLTWRFSTIPGSKIGWARTKKLSKQVSWTSSTRSQRKKIEKIGTKDMKFKMKNLMNPHLSVGLTNELCLVTDLDLELQSNTLGSEEVNSRKVPSKF